MFDETPRADTVERLLEAAEAEFATRGFAEARLEDIAAAAGVRRASLLFHFETKQALYDRVLERAFEAIGAIIYATLSQRSATYAERLDEAVSRSVDELTRRPLFARLLLRDGLDQEGLAAERARRFFGPLLEAADAFVRAGQAASEFLEDVEPRAAIMLLVGAVVFHAASCDALRDVLWGPARASGRGLRAYRDQQRAMVRRLLVVPRSKSTTPRDRAPVPARRPEPRRS
jgi:AcrR family transcriptional regulator